MPAIGVDCSRRMTDLRVGSIRRECAGKGAYSLTECSSFCERRTRSTEYGARRLGS